VFTRGRWIYVCVCLLERGLRELYPSDLLLERRRRVECEGFHRSKRPRGGGGGVGLLNPTGVCISQGCRCVLEASWSVCEMIPDRPLVCSGGRGMKTTALSGEECRICSSADCRRMNPIDLKTGIKN